MVECKPSNRPCYYDDKEFFIRINPATHKLEGSKLDVYKKERFK
uniref:Uncharacterized protein n=1 Tax=uncultured bacterium contig00062 TaxID=1181545 RepID=A0A806K1P7_9BACT|nr:hypothetical protein [uncultured bacterium contig00062]